MASGIIIAKNAGTSLANDVGICTGQSIAAGASFTLDGSLVVGGMFDNEGWGYKIKAVSAGNDTGKTLTLAGRFYASNAAGDYTETTTVTLGNATSVTSALYATRITGARMATATASSVTIGLAADGSGVPVRLSHGSLYQMTYAATFAGGTIQIKGYDELSSEFVAFGTETGETAATKKNYELPQGEIVKAFLSGASTTTAINVQAKIINKQK